MNMHPNDDKQHTTTKNTCRTMILYSNPASIIKNKRYNEYAHSKNQCRTMILYHDPRLVLLKHVKKPEDIFTGLTYPLLSYFLVLSFVSKMNLTREERSAAAELLRSLNEISSLMHNIREDWDISFAELEDMFNEDSAVDESSKREKLHI